MEMIRVEVEIEDRKKVEVLEIEGGNLDAILKAVRALAALEDLHVFERGKEEPLGHEAKDMKALALHAHRCRKVRVKVQFNHKTQEHEFAPSATVFTVLLWAVSRKEFGLDETGKAKANLILPGADQPLPKDDVIGSLIKHGHCELTLDLTLKDFTNG